MTQDITIVLIILGVSVVLFVTEWIRVDVVAMLVLASLAITGVLTPEEALSGFSNTAVITVWAILILSAALSRTGVAGLIGHRILALAGTSELRLTVIIMLTVGILSGFMNSIGVAALFLPVVIDISRQRNIPPSKLLIPLAFAALLGGLNTLIGTPPNILISEALMAANLQPFKMFDYTPVGVTVMLAGVIFMALVGRHLLPSRDIARDYADSGDQDYTDLYNMDEHMVVLRLPEDSTLAGKSLAQSKLGAVLGLNVIAIIRNGQNQLAPDPRDILQAGDRLLVGGRLDVLTELKDHQNLVLEDENLTIEKLKSAEIVMVEASLPPNATLIGQTLHQIKFRQQYGVIVLAIRRGEQVLRTNLEMIPLHSGDILLIQGHHTQMDTLREKSDLLISDAPGTKVYQLEEMLMVVHVPVDSVLVGKTLAESRLGDSFGLGVLGIIRQGETQLMLDPEEQLQSGDTLLVKGKKDDLQTVEGLQNLQIEAQSPPDIDDLESEEVGLQEVVLSPHTTLTGKTLRDLHFREKYELSVLAIWREGRAYRSNLRNMKLRFGDALLLYGPREKIHILGSEPDFLVLTEAAQEAPLLDKAPVAILIMVLVLLAVIIDSVNIAIAAVAGVVLMILTRCLTMEEAYRSIEWKAVFLIAGMLPLGIAMQKTGAASLLAEQMVSLIGDFGPEAVMAGLFILAALASQVMPNPAVAVLLAPIALNTASDLGISPYPLMMAVAVSASAAFLSPVGHPANVLIMGPGGYRFSDYTKVGLPLTVVVLLVVLIVMPIFWPF
jgi:di/tricarboxylate transporter